MPPQFWKSTSILSRNVQKWIALRKSSEPIKPQSTDPIMKALEMLTSSNSFVSRSLQTIKRYSVTPERIDDAIIAAINASLCLVSGGDDHVAEGFNDDIARNGRNFDRTPPAPEPTPREFPMNDLRHDLNRDWQKWTRTERFSAVIILAAMVTVIVPAALEITHQATATTAHQQVRTLARLRARPRPYASATIGFRGRSFQARPQDFWGETHERGSVRLNNGAAEAQTTREPWRL